MFSGRIAAMMIALFTNDPRAMARTTGNSLLGVIPWTYWGVTAASSMITPVAFADARDTPAMTSSMDPAAARAKTAMSSSRAKKLGGIAPPIRAARMLRPLDRNPDGGKLFGPGPSSQALDFRTVEFGLLGSRLGLPRGARGAAPRGRGRQPLAD